MRQHTFRDKTSKLTGAENTCKIEKIKIFLDNNRPMLVSMVTETGIDSAIACVANLIYGGADAL